MTWLQFSGGRVTHWITSDPYRGQLHVALCGKTTRAFAIAGCEPEPRGRCVACQRRLGTDPARNAGEITSV